MFEKGDRLTLTALLVTRLASEPSTSPLVKCLRLVICLGQAAVLRVVDVVLFTSKSQMVAMVEASHSLSVVVLSKNRRV